MGTARVKKTIQSAVHEGRNSKHELDTFLLSYRNTPHCTARETPSFLLFSRVVRYKLPTLLSTVDGSRDNGAVKRTMHRKKKMRTYADAKRRTKSTEIKAGADILVKHTGTKDKLTYY